jgi:glycosyltransferase involved in cell wall biosynthesis
VEPVAARSSRSLRIAQVAPVGTAVKPGAGESVEELVSLLTEELVRRGHQVTLFATGDSQTSANLQAFYEHGYEDDQELWDWEFTETMHVANACTRADEFDVMHYHSYHFALPFTPFVHIPNVQTHHAKLSPAIAAAYHYFAEVHVVVASQFQRRHFEGRPNVELIHQGIDTEVVPFSSHPGDYLLFVGRMIADRGPAQAVEVAAASGMPLVLAGPAEEGFEEEIAPLLDADRVTYVGRVDPTQRDRLLAGAGALVYPLRYPEPVGLVVIESMACGTPVVAVGIGAVPEIVEPGRTGYLAGTWEELAAKVPDALLLDRAAIRARAVERFDFRRMVDQHEQLYLRLAGDGTENGRASAR